MLFSLEIGFNESPISKLNINVVYKPVYSFYKFI